MPRKKGKSQRFVSRISVVVFNGSNSAKDSVSDRVKKRMSQVKSKYCFAFGVILFILINGFRTSLRLT